MQQKWIKITGVLVALQLTLSGIALAQQGGSFALTWSTLGGGGGASSGNNYAVAGTIGQPEVETSTGGTYRLSGGFWAGGVTGSPSGPGPGSGGSNRIFLPLVVK